jgi:hypothetical protein
MTLIGNPALVDKRVETERRVKRIGFSRYYQSRDTTVRVYEQDCTSATDTIASGTVGDVVSTNAPRKDKGNRFFRAQVTTRIEGEWQTGATY